MSAAIAKPRVVGISLPLVVAAIGGAFFGLASCGGYTWHRYTFDAALLASLAYAAFVWRPSQLRFTKYAALLVGALLAYQLSVALVAPMYWAPHSVGEYINLVAQTLRVGPC